MSNIVYVQDIDGNPLMPTKRLGKVRKLLDTGKAVPVQTKPFTIQLTYETTNYTQDIKVGVDTGYSEIGVSAVTEKEEVFSANIELLKEISKRLKQRAMYRRQRRTRLRYRQARFDNRKKSKPKDCLSPSIRHKKDSHLRFIVNEVANILPISEITLEMGNFDIQKIKNPDIKGKEYQEGEQACFYNLREYLFHRDHHECQNPKCNNKGYEHRINGRKKKAVPLQVHHLGYWKKDKSNRPSNLITLCIKCHTPAKHKEENLLWGWQPKLNSFRAATFMNMVRWSMLEEFKVEFPDILIRYTYGHKTKSKRIELGLEKSHINDAFVIANEGVSQTRSKSYQVKQIRRNNRSLEKFYDAKYSDLRDAKKRSGQELSDQRRSRKKETGCVNLRKYRSHKLKAGRRSIRRKRYPLQPYDMVIYRGKKRNYPIKCRVKGTFNKGVWVRLKDPNGKTINSNVKDVELYTYGKGFCFL